MLSGVRTNDMQFGLCGTIDRHLFESQMGLECANSFYLWPLFPFIV